MLGCIRILKLTEIRQPAAPTKVAPKAAPRAAPKAAPVVVKKPVFASSGRFAITDGNAWDIEGASWAVNGGIFGRIGDGEELLFFSTVHHLLV